jgi:opacity protein-like surface antigen
LGEQIMTRRHFIARAAGAVAALAVASTALAADAWSTYRNAEFHVAIDFPGTPEVRPDPAQTPSGVAPGIAGQLVVGQGVLIFGVADYSRLNPGSDLNARLEAAVAGAMSNSKQTLDSETTINVGGVPGRDISSHDAQYVARSRLLMTHDRLYMAVGIAPTANGVPAEYARFAQSMRPD